MKRKKRERKERERAEQERQRQENERAEQERELEERERKRAILISLQPEGFAKIRTVLAVFDTSRSTLWRWISEGRFPAPHKFGP